MTMLSIRPIPNRDPRAAAPALLLRAGAAALVLAGLTGAASAQNEERRIERAVRQAGVADPSLIPRGGTLEERTYVDVGGFNSFTFLNLNDSDTNSRRLIQNDLVLFARASIDGGHNFFARTRFRYRDFSPGDSFDGRGDGWSEPFIDRYWYEFDSASLDAVEGRPARDWGVNVRVGRQFVDWGAGLVLSETLLAVMPTLTFGPATIEGLAGVTPGDESIVDFDASRAEYNSDTQRGFFGLRISGRDQGGSELYGFVMRMEDYNTDTASSVPNVTQPVDFNYDAWYLGVGATGSLSADSLLLGELVYESGASRSDPLLTPDGSQTRETIHAFAARAQIVHFLRDARDTRLSAEILLASGDSDRRSPTDTVGGNAPGTNDTGFNSMGFANTGLAFSPSLSNLWSTRLGVSAFPFRTMESTGDGAVDQLQLGADLFFFNKFNRSAPVDEPSDDTMYLGTEFDLSANYRITSDLAIGLRWGVFFPGSALEADNTRNFVLATVTLSF
jgi:hypothetical protein